MYVPLSHPINCLPGEIGISCWHSNLLYLLNRNSSFYIKKEPKKQTSMIIAPGSRNWDLLMSITHCPRFRNWGYQFLNRIFPDPQEPWGKAFEFKKKNRSFKQHKDSLVMVIPFFLPAFSATSAWLKYFQSWLLQTFL